MKKATLKIMVIVGLLLSACQNLYAQWNIISTVSTHVIWNIKFVDANTVYAVGSKTLMKSIDGGNNWIDLIPNLNGVSPDSNFYNLCFLSKDTGFVFINDTAGNIIRTNDGGITWSNASNSLFPFGILDMQFLNSNIGYAPIQMAFDSSLAKTIDGGNTWLRLNSPTNCWYPLSIYFRNTLIGFYGQDEIYKTMDGGQTWTMTNLSTGWKANNRITEYIFSDSNNGLALTERWNLYRTTDGGNNWSEITIPISSGSSASYNMAFDQNQFGYITSFAVSNPFVSDDGGSTWVLDASFPKYYTPICVSTSLDHKVIIGTGEGKVMIKQNNPLSIGLVDKGDIISIFPNPTMDFLNYTTSIKVDAIEIINSVGRNISSIKPNGLNRIDMTSYDKGLYLIIFKTKEGVIQRKAIKM